MRLIIAMFLAFVALSSAAWADDKSKVCLNKEDCDRLKALGKRYTLNLGVPDPEMVCFPLLMRPLTAVSMKITYADGSSHTEELPKGSAERMAGYNKHTGRAFCIKDWRLRNAVSALVCTTPEDSGGSTTLSEADLRRLLTQRNVLQTACLLGIEECARTLGDKTAGKDRK